MHRARQQEADRIAAQRLLFDLRSAGVAEAKQFGGLVERFADRVVDGRAESAVVADAEHRNDLSVAAGDEQQQ